MNSLVDKFKEICTKKITLPDGGDITISKLNVEFQSKLYKEIEVSENDYIVILKYMLYVNKHICSLYRDYNFTYKDKLCLINYWVCDMNSTPLEELNFEVIDNLNNTNIDLQLDKSLMNVQFIQSNILQENRLLEFLLDKPGTEIGRMSVVFFDIFRFVKSIKINDQTFLTENISIEDFFKLFELLSINHLQLITTKISEVLEDVSLIREQEADITSFY